ncbi:MAG: hypothetical protein ABIY38_07910 [Rhodococcus sp. (in: high G+C Gram-positive bacteria)]
MTDYQSPDDLLLKGGGGSKSFPFTNPGDTVTGIIVAKKAQQRFEFDKQGKPDLTKPIVYRDGNPAMQIVLTLQTDIRDPNAKDGEGNPVEDDGKRSLYIKSYGQFKDALAEAVRASGEEGLTLGSRITVTYTHQSPPANAGISGEKNYAVKFVGPADAALTPAPETGGAHDDPWGSPPVASGSFGAPEAGGTPPVVGGLPPEILALAGTMPADAYAALVAMALQNK